jgi:AcrR family transcriptional regulator
MDSEKPDEGRRERKKRATRELIAATARRLFVERGFDAVTVAEIAAAADVAEKTVFNHFATKEDLAFAGRDRRTGALLARLAQRPAGTPVIDVFRAATDAMFDDLLTGGDAEALALTRIVLGSPALQQRLAAGWEEEAAALAALIARSVGAADDDVRPAVVGRTLVWTHRTLLRLAVSALLAGEDPQAMAGRLRVQATRAYDLLESGLGDYGT